jgi:cytochrome c-type biogenesis protein CcmH
MLLAGGAPAAQAAGPAPDPALEQRVTHLAEELRCLVCQNQTIADSQAPLAIDLKNQMREKLAQGLPERDVIEFMVQRYGDFVLYRPPLKPRTWLLWFGPFLLLGFGLLLLLMTLRRQPASDQAIAEAEMVRAAALLAEHPLLKEAP